MVYLPTVGCCFFMVNIGKYTIHGAYGQYINPTNHTSRMHWCSAGDKSIYIFDSTRDENRNLLFQSIFWDQPQICSPTALEQYFFVLFCEGLLDAN